MNFILHEDDDHCFFVSSIPGFSSVSPSFSKCMTLMTISQKSSGAFSVPFALKFFHGAAITLLFITGTAKLALVFDQSAYLAVKNGVFDVLSNRVVFLTVGLLELIIASICLKETSSGRRSALIGWLGLMFLLYRVVLHFLGFKGRCHCFGTLGDAFGLGPEAEHWIGWLSILFLLGGPLAHGVFHAFAQGRVQNTLKRRHALEPQSCQSTPHL